jgi:uncharacterized protein
MSLKDKINDDLKAAMIAKDTVRTETLRSIRAEILKADKSGSDREMNEQEEIEMLSKQAKMRRESIEQFESAGRADLVDKEKAQLEIIEEYLPEQMSQEDAEKVIDKIIADTGASGQQDFGKVMGGAMKELKGKIDGKVIQDIVKSRLS